MRVGILGDGPAGTLAGWLFKKYGHDVTLWSNGRRPPQARHIHIYDKRLPGVLDALGVPPASQAEKMDWHLITVSNPGHIRRDWRGARCGRESICNRLRLVSLSPVCFDGGDVREFDLLLDASGAARGLLRHVERQGFEATSLDCGGMECYRSWQGRREASNSAAHLIRIEDNHTLYLQCRDESWHLTLIEGAAEEPLSESSILALLEKWGVSAALPKVKTMSGPTARRIEAESCLASGLSLIPFGDALVQTSPSLGFGLLSVAQQAAILKDWLEEDGSVMHLAHQLDAYAEAIWHEAALSSLLKNG